MADMQFAQLHNPEFLARTRHIPAEGLAAQVGCQPATVESYRQHYGIFRRPHWSPVEIELLTRFYGRFPTAYIARGLGRSIRSLHCYASRHGLRIGSVPRASAGAEAAFWPAWQATIRSSWPRWQRQGLGESALGLLWRPPQRVVDCSVCAHLAACRGLGRLPLRCERLSLGDVLELHLSQEDRALCAVRRAAGT